MFDKLLDLLSIGRMNEEVEDEEVAEIEGEVVEPEPRVKTRAVIEEHRQREESLCQTSLLK